MPSGRRTPMIEVRHSPIHGHGVFALRKIRKGTRVIEYRGDRVSHEVADARYEGKHSSDNHTFLFTVDSKTVIDAGVEGNDARFINHACDPNCESVISNKRVYIEAIRTIRPGDELSYDYRIQRDLEDSPDVDAIFACRCGAANCRGSMLEPRKKPRTAKRPPRSKRAQRSKRPQTRKSRARGKQYRKSSRRGG
jgi:uncharacterized protein